LRYEARAATALASRIHVALGSLWLELQVIAGGYDFTFDVDVDIAFDVDIEQRASRRLELYGGGAQL
jgi:hypothetical protein